MEGACGLGVPRCVGLHIRYPFLRITVGVGMVSCAILNFRKNIDQAE